MDFKIAVLAGDGIRAEAVNGALDADIGNGKDHTLQSGRNADDKNLL